MTTTNMVRLELGGDVEEIEESRWEEAADRLVKKHGGVPKVTRLGTPVAAQTYDIPAGASVGGHVIAPVATAMTTDQVVDAINRSGAPATATKVREGVIATTGPIMTPTRKPSRGLTVGSPLDAPVSRIDLIGQARSTFDAEAAAAEGFAVAAPMFDRGTKIDAAGTAHARRLREEWEAMPTVIENCRAHAARIAAEDRQDDVALATATRMHPSGVVITSHVDAPNHPETYRLSEEAFGAMVTRMQIPAAGRYLRQCWPELRAANVNGWIERLAASEATAAAAARAAGVASTYEPIDLRLRHRLLSRPDPSGAVAREVFAIVSPSYGDFDSDKLDEAIARVVPPEARGRVTYDGRRSRWEIVFHTPVQPKHFVVGEFFRAGVVITTDDGGSGAINGHAFARQSLCKNVIFIQTTTTAHFSIRHMGDLEVLAGRFADGFKKARGAIDHFVRAWDMAVEDDVVETVRRVARADGRSLPESPDEIMAGIFRDAIERDLVPVRGVKLEPAVNGLIRAWREDESAAAGPTRAAVANAFTRWIHTTVNADPWQEDETQEAAGMLIRRTKNDNGWATSLGYLAPEDVKGR